MDRGAAELPRDAARAREGRVESAPRSRTRFSGIEFVGVSPLDLVHAESQAVWDLRRLIGWIRRQAATHVGVFGISLGGYTSAVLAGIEDGLACVIAGVPPSDLIATG